MGCWLNISSTIDSLITRNQSVRALLAAAAYYDGIVSIHLYSASCSAHQSEALQAHWHVHTTNARTPHDDDDELSAQKHVRRILCHLTKR